jgi:hypothetical protein
MALAAPTNPGGTMIVRLLTLLALSILGISATRADRFYIQAVARDPGVEHSISLEIHGPTNHPFPVVYISTRHFRTRVSEYVVVLNPPRYDVVSKYTQTMISGADCSGRSPVGDDGYTVKVIKHDNGYTGQCVLPRALACAYLRGVTKLPAVNWTSEELRPIAEFSLEIRCDSVAATSVGAN